MEQKHIENMKEWFIDDDFWKFYAPVIFDDKHWAEVPEVADGVTRLAALKLYGQDGLSGASTDGLSGVSPGGGGSPRALDVCCGVGRITLELARRGFLATGVDMCSPILEAAKEDAAYEKLDIEYIKDDVRHFKRPEFFDVAVNLYISFGYFEKAEDDLLLARNVFESLKPGGCFIIETLGKEIAVRDFTTGEWFERAGYTVLTEYAVIDSWAGLKNRWVLISDDSKAEGEAAGKAAADGAGRPNRLEKTFTQRLYSATEMRDLLFKAGFKAVEIYGGWDERPYDQNAQILIAVGRKKPLPEK